jgi:hypothetical protein
VADTGQLRTLMDVDAFRADRYGWLWTPVDTAWRSTDQKVGGSSPSERAIGDFEGVCRCPRSTVAWVPRFRQRRRCSLPGSPHAALCTRIDLELRPCEPLLGPSLKADVEEGAGAVSSGLFGSRTGHLGGGGTRQAA